MVIRKLPSTSESPVPDPSSAVSTDERPSSGETRSDPLQPGQDINVLVKTEHVDLADSVGTVDEKQAGGEGPIEVVSNRADVRKDELDEVKEAKEAKESETGLKRDGPPMEDESGTFSVHQDSNDTPVRRDVCAGERSLGLRSSDGYSGRKSLHSATLLMIQATSTAGPANGSDSPNTLPSTRSHTVMTNRQSPNPTRNSQVCWRDGKTRG